jgi:anti-sigma factor RsiW
MDCKEFATKHPAFLDDTLPGYQMSAVRDHLAECARCARRDAEVRRALLLLRNLPPVRVSDGFQDRLRARLAAEPAVASAGSSDFGMARWGAAAVLLVAIVGVGLWPDRGSQDTAPTRLPAVFASTPPVAQIEHESAPEYVASMSTGIPMWPALMLAEEGPLRFAGMQNASWDASRQHD